MYDLEKFVLSIEVSIQWPSTPLTRSLMDSLDCAVLVSMILTPQVLYSLCFLASFRLLTNLLAAQNLNMREY